MAKKKPQTRTRRANNEGSIFQRKDGRWAGYVSNGYDENGNPKRKIIYGKNRTDVAKKLTEISGRIKSNSYELMETKNFGELMQEWLLSFKKSAVTPRTFEGSMRNFKLHIMPVIGKMKVYDVDTYAVQRTLNKMIDEGYSIDTIKKCKHIIGQFFEYAIDNNWVEKNPAHKVRLQSRDRKVYSDKEKYKALTPEAREKFLQALNRDEANFIKPLCICLMFAGLRIGEALALKWENVDFKNKTLKVERAITQIPKFDGEGNVTSRVTVVGDTKTACSVREVPLIDLVVQTLRKWKEKQEIREKTNSDVKAKLTAPSSYVFSNDDGSVRTYSGSRVIFDRFKHRNGLDKYNIHFHGLRHTFSNMMFELNENPKVIQQLLGHRDVKTTISVYNSVDSDYVRSATDKLNEKVIEDENERQSNEYAELSDENLDLELERLIQEKEKRARHRKQEDFEM